MPDIDLQPRHDGDQRAAVRCSIRQTVNTVGTASALLLPQNTDRCYLRVQNNGANALYLAFGQDATEENGVMIAAGAVFEPRVAPVQSVFALMATAAGDVVTLEGV